MIRNLFLLLCLCFLVKAGEPDRENSSRWQYTIRAQQLVNGEVLQDGDIVFVEEVTNSDGCVAEDSIAFEMFLVNPVTRWKGLGLHNVDQTHLYMMLLEMRGNWAPSTVHLRAEEMTMHFFVLWKYDPSLIGGGDREATYWVEDAAQFFEAGKHYRFFWTMD